METPTRPMFDLSALQARAKALVAEADAAKAAAKAEADARARLRVSTLSSAEREALVAKLREWELARDYAPDAVVFRVQRITCACGSVTYGIGQLMLRQRHLRTPGTKRYLPLPKGPWPDLPRHTETDECEAEICFDCAPAHGFGGKGI